MASRTRRRETRDRARFVLVRVMPRLAWSSRIAVLSALASYITVTAAEPFTREAGRCAIRDNCGRKVSTPHSAAMKADD